MLKVKTIIHEQISRRAKIGLGIGAGLGAAAGGLYSAGEGEGLDRFKSGIKNTFKLYKDEKEKTPTLNQDISTSLIKLNEELKSLKQESDSLKINIKRLEREISDSRLRVGRLPFEKEFDGEVEQNKTNQLRQLEEKLKQLNLQIKDKETEISNAPSVK